MRILLGHQAASSPFGFDPHSASEPNSLVAYEGDAPVTVIAPTGSGKTRDLLIPTILEHDGPVITIDVKGELTSVCARRRKEMGYRVAVLDPFRIVTPEPDRLNPFDIFSLPGSNLETDAEMLAASLSEGHMFGSDPFWSDCSCGLYSGLFATISANEPPAMQHMATLRDMLFADDVDYSLATRLDQIGKLMPRMAYREIAAYLQHPSDKTRPCVLSTARTFLRAMNTDQVTDCMKESSIDLNEVVEGKPLDIFIVFPAEKLKSHRCLLRVWVSTLLNAIMRRREIPERRTLMVLDEAAQLGAFEPLLTAATLLRGFGLSLITAWQDLAQMKTSYPKEYQTLLNNSGAVMAFGMGHYAAAKDAAEFLGLEPSELLGMKPDEAALSIRGEGVRKVRRLNYLKDERYAGQFDPNPFFRRRNAMGR